MAGKRKAIEAGIDYMLIPTNDAYRRHVSLRIRHCVTLTLEIWTYHAWAQKQSNQAQLRRMSSAIAPTATAQAGKGCYGGPSGKLDAAHLTNTTAKVDVLLEGQGHLTPDQEKGVRELETFSAATTPQLKGDNIGPDKVIDTCMTQFTQECAQEGDKGGAVVRAEQAVQWLGNMCKKALEGNPNSGEANYQQAIEGVRDAMRDPGLAAEIQKEVKKWAEKYKFE